MAQSNRIAISSSRDLISIIATAREARGFSLRELGAATDLAHATLANAIDRGDTKLSTALLYLEALGYRMEVVRERRL